MKRGGARDLLRRVLPLTLTLFVLSCGPNRTHSSSQSVLPPTLEVEYAGCEAVLEPGPVCVLAAQRQVQLWVGAPPGVRIRIEAEGRRIDAAGDPVQKGRRFSLTLPSPARRLGVLAEAAKEQARWSLALAEPASEKAHDSRVRQRASRDMIQEVAETARPLHKLIRGRQFVAARKTLNGLRPTPKSPAEFRYHVTYFRGLLAEKEGDYRSAMAEIQQAIGIAERVKLDRYRWLAEEKLALLLCGVGRCREAAEIFERLHRTPHAANSCDEADFLNNQAWAALLAREAGESLRDPTPLLEKSLAAYEICPGVGLQDKVNVLINLALADLQEGRLEPAKDLMARAHRLEAHPPPIHALWLLDLQARIALRERRPAEAMQRFADLAELAMATGSSDGSLRAALGKARSQQALGDRTAALEILRQAEALLDEQSLQIPFQKGREIFLATRQAVVSLHLDLLLAEARTAEALAVARHARSRMLRQLEHGDRLANLTPDRRARWEQLITEYQSRRTALEERAKDDWKVPDDQLPRERAARQTEAEAVKELLDQAFLLLGAPGERLETAPPSLRPGELLLAYHPIAGGWVGFAADGKTVEARRFELPPDVLSQPEELSRRLLLPFRARIARARQIRILSSGPLQGVDFHRLPFDGDVLLRRCPVVYGLDLPAAADPAPAAGRRALLVADPRGDLPGAVAEARRVGAVLKAGSPPWDTREVNESEASAQAVRSLLAGADLLHYAGHGTFSGFGGWESGLLLAEDSRLTLGDLLALDRVPAWVVLSGCETGRSSAETPVESLGLAHAFLLAGSREVVASTRPADDRAVPAFFAELYRRWDREPDLAVALQRAQLAWRERSPQADWASFRLFVP